MSRRATLVALVPLVLALALLTGREYDRGGVLTSDTLQLLDGTAAADTCLHDDQLRCRTGVSWWPPLQYIPALALKRLGVSRQDTGNDLVYLNGLAALAVLALLWASGWRSRAPALAPLLVLAGLVSPLLWYGDTGFAEALAAATTTCFVVSITLGWNPIVTAVALWLTVISKETALPFGLLLGAVALCVRSPSDRGQRPYVAALAAGALMGVLTIVALNLFRYGVPWNRYYVRGGWAVPSYMRRGEFFVAQLVAPNAGLIWFWPVASSVFAVAGVQAARALRTGAAVRRRAGATAAAILIFAALLATLASWWSPFGWEALGSRLVVPWIPALLVLLAAAWGARLHAAFAWVACSLPVLVAMSGLVLFLGLGQLGALLHPMRPLDLFSQTHCALPPHLLQQIPAGDPQAHRAHEACLSRQAWRERPVLVSALGSLGGGNLVLALFYSLALAGLVTGATMSVRRTGIGPRIGASHTSFMDARQRGKSATAGDHTGSDWRLHGVRVVHADELDGNTPQTPGMDRAAAITAARAGAEKLWAGTVLIQPDAKTGAHHHGSLESVIYVVSGRARMRWGERLEFTAEAGPGDFIFVPPFVPHQEINANADTSLSCVVVRSGQEPVVVNLDLPEVEANPEQVHWVDDIHPKP